MTSRLGNLDARSSASRASSARCRSSSILSCPLRASRRALAPTSAPKLNLTAAALPSELRSAPLELGSAEAAKPAGSPTATQPAPQSANPEWSAAARSRRHPRRSQLLLPGNG
eukprot:2569251-Prymnesium_polylepis.2